MLLNKQRAYEVMDRRGLDALIAISPNNVYYLSDYETDLLYDPPWIACAILPRSEDVEPCLIITEIDLTCLVERPSWMPDIRTYYFALYGQLFPTLTFNKDQPLTGDDAKVYAAVQELKEKGTVGLMDALIPALKEKGLTRGKLGFDDVRLAMALGDVVEEADIVDATNDFIEIRMVKTPDEIAILRESAKKNQAAVEGAIATIEAGALWQDVYTAYEAGVAKQHARVFATFNGAGPKGAGAGRLNRDYAIKDGDMVCLDCMLKYRRYMGDCQRTVAVGAAPEKLERYWRALKMGVDEGYSSIRAGVSTSDLRNQALETVRKNGVPDFEVAFIHSIGLDHLEVPAVEGGSLGVFTLQPNMVVNMDMEIHEIGYGGLFFEESMLVTENGAERLYSLPRDMIRV